LPGQAFGHGEAHAEADEGDERGRVAREGACETTIAVDPRQGRPLLRPTGRPGPSDAPAFVHEFRRLTPQSQKRHVDAGATALGFANKMQCDGGGRFSNCSQSGAIQA
jgi:hypothetical protein